MARSRSCGKSAPGGACLWSAFTLYEWFDFDDENNEMLFSYAFALASLGYQEIMVLSLTGSPQHLVSSLTQTGFPQKMTLSTLGRAPIEPSSTFPSQCYLVKDGERLLRNLTLSRFFRCPEPAYDVDLLAETSEHG